MKICPSKSEKKYLELDQEQLEQLVQRVETGALREGDAQIIKALIESLVLLSGVVDKKAATIQKLLRMIFGASTEKKDVIIPKKDETAKETEKENKGHGRNGQQDYPKAPRITVKHPELTPGSPCPECEDGKLYPLEPGIEIRIKGAPPLQATVYELEKFRCNLCQKIFTAPLPAEAGAEKYDASAAAMIGLLKYGAGMPFNRLAGLQENLGIPLPTSTQWDVTHARTEQLTPVFQELIREAAQGEVLHNDDTNAKILDVIKENKKNKPKRKGTFTTGIVSRNGERKIILFFTGRDHAGENMAKVLKQREEGKDPPIQMCDASSRNLPPEYIVLLTLCLVHARRNFIDAAQHFPEICAHILETLAEVYRVDAEAKERQMTPEQRLLCHQEQSGPRMAQLHDWLEKKVAEKVVEPNSPAGKAISYMLDHWKELTEFLRTPNAPLDNNICERALKKAILHRKNALFFKSEEGARTADIYMSLIATCEQAGVNPFDYLVALMENHEQVKAAPAAWLPWNYPSRLLP